MVILKIAVVILIMVAGGAFGYALANIKALEKLNDIQAGLDRCVENHNKLIEASDNALGSARSYVAETYRALVKLRDGDTENLDELIGRLGAFLDDTKA